MNVEVLMHPHGRKDGPVRPEVEVTCRDVYTNATLCHIVWDVSNDQAVAFSAPNDEAGHTGIRLLEEYLRVEAMHDEAHTGRGLNLLWTRLAEWRDDREAKEARDEYLDLWAADRAMRGAF